MKKIVVTGALGHIGSRVIREFPMFFPGVSIYMIDNMLTQRYSSLFNLPGEGHYKFIEADILETDLEPIIGGADVVLHLAAITDAASSVANRDKVEFNNYNTTVKVAEACSKTGSPLIHMSSTSTYGTQNEIVDEECSEEELKPQSPYAETKLKEERFLQRMGCSSGLRFIICRFGTICGISPGMRFHTAVNKFCWQAAMCQPLTVWRTALYQKRPYLTLDDAIGAYRFIIDNKLFDNRVYNILTDNLTVDQVIRTISKYVSNLSIKYVDTEIMNQLSYEVSGQRFRAKGFRYLGSMEESIKNTIGLIGRSCSIDD